MTGPARDTPRSAGNTVAVLAPGDVVASVPDGATVALTDSGVFLEADALFAVLERAFLETGHPRDLTLVHALGIGDGERSGLNRFAHEGMVARVIGGHWSWSPAMQRLARDERIAAYSFPAGVISTLLREIGAGRPGVITRIGLGTFADPRLGGGRCNESATEELVERVELDGRSWLRYKPFAVDVGLVRGTAVDPAGNVSFEREPADLDAWAVALAARNCGGRVLVQVEERRTHRILPSRLARLPGVLVDGVLLAPEARRTYLPGHDPHLSGEVPTEQADERANDGPIGGAIDGAHGSLPTGLRRIIAERAAREIAGARTVNFGFGIPGGIPALLEAEGRDDYWGTIEQGIHNGRMLDGPMFGAARDPDAIVPSIDQFDFYSGGGLDVAFLGMGELDSEGNVNVSLIGDALIGPGGFVDITQTAKKVVFCGTFEAKGLRVDRLAGGNLHIERHGDIPKLVEKVRHVTFSGSEARANGQEVLYVTERAVFRLGAEGLDLVEVSPGVDLRRDVLDRMPFAPRVALRITPGLESRA